MLLLDFLKIFISYKDIEVFWKFREKIIENKKGKKLFQLCCIKVRRNYCSGIPISEKINKYNSPHGFYGIFISKKAELGKNCTIFQQVTIGVNDLENSKKKGAPIIGDNCLIGAGAKIIGGVKIGNNVRIGANAIVVEDIPDNCTVVMHKSTIKKRG